MSTLKNYRYILNGLDCASCAKKIEDKIASTEGYEEVTVNFSTSKLSFKTEKQANVKEEITQIIKKLEPDVEISEEKEEEKSERSNLDIIRIILGVLIYAIGNYLNFGKNISIIFSIIALAILLLRTTKKAFKQITKSKILDENALITISCIGAFLVDKQTEGIMVIVLYEIGKILEAKAVNKTRKSITSLMNIRPEYANLVQGEETKKVNPEEVKIGDIILVKAGEKIPLDGIVIKGNAEIDNQALTGESKLISVKEKSEVLSGGINIQGLIKL